MTYEAGLPASYFFEAALPGTAELDNAGFGLPLGASTPLTFGSVPRMWSNDRFSIIKTTTCSMGLGFFTSRSYRVAQVQDK